MSITLRSGRGFEYLKMTPIAELRSGWADAVFDLQICYSRWDEGEPVEVCYDFVNRIARVDLESLAGLIEGSMGNGFVSGVRGTTEIVKATLVGTAAHRAVILTVRTASGELQEIVVDAG